ncbi:hypothetical protein HAX54_002892, partial [Datura stramonium]|nr:hypothetical protein [Datura stramonium]
ASFSTSSRILTKAKALSSASTPPRKGVFFYISTAFCQYKGVIFYINTVTAEAKHNIHAEAKTLSSTPASRSPMYRSYFLHQHNISADAKHCIPVESKTLISNQHCIFAEANALYSARTSHFAEAKALFSIPAFAFCRSKGVNFYISTSIAFSLKQRRYILQQHCILVKAKTSSSAITLHFYQSKESSSLIDGYISSTPSNIEFPPRSLHQIEAFPSHM